MKSFYWYDLETTGTDPRWDRIIQFAGIRTDEQLNPIGDEHCQYVQLAPDVLPNPDAALVTGLTPQLVNREGTSEWQALTHINSLFSQPQTCVAGYNSLRFDDEFMRYGLYRNLLDPYAREWQHGNSRWDLIDLVRATGALRPEGIEWPVDDQGLRVYKLERLTQANGLEHGQAHDALSDVRATIAMAKLIQQRQPKLFDYYLNNSHKKAVRAVLQPLGHKLCVHVSGMYPRAQYGCAPVVGLAQHPTNSNAIVVADLSTDIDLLLDLSADEIRRRLFSRTDEARPGLKEIRINRCPFVADIKVLTRENQARLGIDLALVSERLAGLQKAVQQTDLLRKLAEVYAGFTPPASIDVDAALYDGFLRDDDRVRSASLQQHLADNQWTQMDFDDKRLVELNIRLKARSFSQLLQPQEVADWQELVASRLNAGDQAPWLTLSAYSKRLGELESSMGADETAQQAVLAQLREYGRDIAACYPAP